ncbi:universal stress protein [Streptomyces sp. bgisy100]|uniref:universal stress protein n=1 Tax=Streptomyces sp. bgisy100 TaxID=3413783 RepID=UPI003D727227
MTGSDPRMPGRATRAVAGASGGPGTAEREASAVVDPVVVGVDGSDPGWRAADWAADEAARHGLPLRVVHASWWERYDTFIPSTSVDRAEARIAAADLVASAEQRLTLRQPGLTVSGAVLAMDPVKALVEEGRSAHAVVVGNRGLGTLAEMLLGSVGLGLAGQATCPVLVVRGREENETGRFRRVVLGVSRGNVDSHAVGFAFQEAAARGAELVAVHAWRRSEERSGAAATGESGAETLLDSALSRAAPGHEQVPVVRESAEGSPRHVLLKAAESADLLVVGARRRHGLFGLELGLVNHAVLHHAVCPVALVPRNDEPHVRPTE